MNEESHTGPILVIPNAIWGFEFREYEVITFLEYPSGSTLADKNAYQKKMSYLIILQYFEG